MTKQIGNYENALARKCKHTPKHRLSEDQQEANVNHIFLCSLTSAAAIHLQAIFTTAVINHEKEMSFRGEGWSRNICEDLDEVFMLVWDFQTIFCIDPAIGDKDNALEMRPASLDFRQSMKPVIRCSWYVEGATNVSDFIVSGHRLWYCGAEENIAVHRRGNL